MSDKGRNVIIYNRAIYYSWEEISISRFVTFTSISESIKKDYWKVEENEMLSRRGLSILVSSLL